MFRFRPSVQAKYCLHNKIIRTVDHRIQQTLHLENFRPDVFTNYSLRRIIVDHQLCDLTVFTLPPLTGNEIEKTIHFTNCTNEIVTIDKVLLAADKDVLFSIARGRGYRIIS